MANTILEHIPEILHKQLIDEVLSLPEVKKRLIPEQEAGPSHDEIIKDIDRYIEQNKQKKQS